MTAVTFSSENIVSVHCRMIVSFEETFFALLE